MWIVKLALSRPYTFIVLALVLILISPVILLRTPVDILPNVNIPVISVIWTYSGLAPAEFSIAAVLQRKTSSRLSGSSPARRNRKRMPLPTRGEPKRSP